MSQQQAQNRGQHNIEDLAEILIQGVARFIDIQASAAETIMRAQARSAAMFGFPDWSGALPPGNGRQLSELFATSAEEGLNVLRQTNETMCKLQQQFNDVLTQQTSQLTAQMRSSMEEIARRTQEGLGQVRETTQQAVEAAQRQTRFQGTEKSKRTTGTTA